MSTLPFGYIKLSFFLFDKDMRILIAKSLKYVHNYTIGKSNMSTWIYVIVLDFQDNNDLITFYYIIRIGILTHKGVNSYNIKVV